MYRTFAISNRKVIDEEYLKVHLQLVFNRRNEYFKEGEKTMEEVEGNHLTTGSVGKTLIQFAMPYLLACFMQTFYGMADLFVVGLYQGADGITAVSVGSQVTHMLTVIIVGFAMGGTVHIGRAVGAGNHRQAAKIVGTTALFFMVFSVGVTLLLFCLTNRITAWMQTPVEAVGQTVDYLRVCFLGIPFITAYNVISSVFRGTGDSKRPMYFVGIACIVNILLDFLFVGGLGLGALGAALATVFGQAVSSVVALWFLKRKPFLLTFLPEDFRFHREILSGVLKVGTPIAMQDGLIQISFIVITMIANSRGLIAATGVGIVEKLIGFFFLVPSAFLSAISAVTAQNMGAGKPERARQSLKYGLVIVVAWGVFCCVYNQFLPDTLVGLFTREQGVLAAGCAYMRSYSVDCIFAGIHFCFSGYFCGDGKSGLSFLHNIVSIIFIRIPGAYFASKWFPESLYPMGWAAPVGSLLSVFICVGCYVYIRRREQIKNG